MSNFSRGEVPKITYISGLVREKRQKACSCKNRKLVLDITNRTVECSVCGQFIDPFDALCELSEKFDREDSYIKSRNLYAEELNKWFKNHKEPIALKGIIEHYRNGMLPVCPKCKKVFDLPEIKEWCGRQFYERLKQAESENKNGDS